MPAAQSDACSHEDASAHDGGKLIVLTAPLTETIDHAGYFIQMAMASLPIWMEGVLNKKYPKWREVEYKEDGSALYMPAGVRLVEKSLLREYLREEIACCLPEDLHKFIGPRTRVVAVSTHNPLGVTFAAGVYTSMFGSSKMPINSHYAREMFARIKESPYRDNFKVIVGGSGGWQIIQTDTFGELGVDCVVEGRSESADSMELFRRAIRGEDLPRQIEVAHPVTPEAILFPDERTTFGVVEMTTGCGRRCKFCVPDLNPQIDLPKEKIMEAVRANVRNGNKQISLATEDMFIWGQVHTDTPFYFPNREALLDLYSEIVNTPGVEQHILSHCTIAPGRRPHPHQEALRVAAAQEPDSLPLPEQPSREEGARAADRTGNRLRADGETDHVRQGCALLHRRLAQRRARRLTHSEREQLVSRDDPDCRQSGRDRRGYQGDA
jgi:hypothetical protein